MLMVMWWRAARQVNLLHVSMAADMLRQMTAKNNLRRRGSTRVHARLYSVDPPGQPRRDHRRHHRPPHDSLQRMWWSGVSIMRRLDEDGNEAQQCPCHGGMIAMVRCSCMSYGIPYIHPGSAPTQARRWATCASSGAAGRRPLRKYRAGLHLQALTVSTHT
jgi:hypothetical protein